MKKMTVVFDDDALYTTVKVEAARRNQPVKKLVCQALTEWLEAQEDTELLSEIEAALAFQPPGVAGLKGGKARAEKLPPKERREIAKGAAAAK